ncbi:MAG: hypothetical protein ABEH58_07685, partial [Haloplanus sp.]
MSDTDAESEEPRSSESEEPRSSESEDAGTTADGGDEPIPVGVKLGSTRTVITIPDGDGLRTVKTLTCLATYDDVITGEEKVLYGEEAATEYPDRVQYTLRSGLPEDESRAELTSTFFREVIEANDVPENSAVVYAIPTIDNER